MRSRRPMAVPTEPILPLAGVRARARAGRRPARTWLTLLVAGLCCGGCRSGAHGRRPPTAAEQAEAAKDAPEVKADEAARLVRSTERNVVHFQELLAQGQVDQMVTMRRAIARTVDADFLTFAKMATEGRLVLQRNMAVKCLAFALEKRAEARELLTRLCRDKNLTIVQNAALGLGILRDRETDLTVLIELLAHPDLEVRTNAGTSLRDLFLIRETPRDLPPQYWTAIDRLVALMHEKSSPRARRAGVWALANLRHPEVLDHLVAALADDDEYVQRGGLRGIEVLGDQRALKPVLEYLDDGPSSANATWARRALVAIAVQGGFAKTPSELEDLGTESRDWKKWFEAARVR